MTDLIFHLGLTKCASSFLQHRILHGKMHTLGRSIDLELDRKDAKQFRIDFTSKSPCYWKEEGIKWFEKYSVDKDLGPVIISHESLYEHIPFTQESLCLKSEPYLLSLRLSNISKYAWNHGKVKVWFFFRRQADWLPSMYAHNCYQLSSPSQSDFETRTIEFINSGFSASHVIDYNLLFESLELSLGRDNVLALPFEAIGEEWVWNEIRNFTGDEKLIRDSSFNNREINVKRKVGESDWKASNLANKKLDTFSSIYKKMKHIGFKLPNSLKEEIKNKLLKKGLRVSMPIYLEEKIINRYKKSNIDLSKKINIDLNKYNYW